MFSFADIVSNSIDPPSIIIVHSAYPRIGYRNCIDSISSFFDIASNMIPIYRHPITIADVSTIEIVPILSSVYRHPIEDIHHHYLRIDKIVSIWHFAYDNDNDVTTCSTDGRLSKSYRYDILLTKYRHHISLLPIIDFVSIGYFTTEYRYRIELAHRSLSNIINGGGDVSQRSPPLWRQFVQYIYPPSCDHCSLPLFSCPCSRFSQ